MEKFMVRGNETLKIDTIREKIPMNRRSGYLREPLQPTCKGNLLHNRSVL